MSRVLNAQTRFEARGPDAPAPAATVDARHEARAAYHRGVWQGGLFGAAATLAISAVVFLFALTAQERMMSASFDAATDAQGRGIAVAAVAAASGHPIAPDDEARR